MARKTFRVLWFVALMAALLFLYALHPIAGWVTLGTLFVVLIAVYRRKAPAEAGR